MADMLPGSNLDAMQSSAERAVPLRGRPDLHAERIVYGDAGWFVEGTLEGAQLGADLLLVLFLVLFGIIGLRRVIGGVFVRLGIVLVARI